MSDFFSLIAQVWAFTELCKLLRTCLVALKINGPGTEAYSHVVASFVLVVLWTAVGRAERIFNVLPEIDLYAFMTTYIMIPFCVLAVSLRRLDRVLSEHHSEEERERR